MIRPSPPRTQASPSPQPLEGQDPRQDAAPAEVAAGRAGASSPRSLQHRSSASERALRSSAATLPGRPSPPTVDGQGLTRGLPPAPAGSKRTSSQANLPLSARRTVKQPTAPGGPSTEPLQASREPLADATSPASEQLPAHSLTAPALATDQSLLALGDLLSPEDEALLLTLFADDPADDASAPASASPGPQQALDTSMPSDSVGPPVSKLSAELMDKVASYLPAREVSALGGTNKTIRQATEERLGSLQRTQASHVQTLEQLRELLGAINGLQRTELRTEPLRQAMLRIRALPPEDRREAIAEFQEAVHGLPVDDRPLVPPRLLDILSHQTPEEAVTAGENVEAVAVAFGVTSPEQIASLEHTTLLSDMPNTAAAALRAGRNVTEVAAEFGITSLYGRGTLEFMVARADDPSGARAAVRAGRSVAEVAAEFGITLAMALLFLESEAGEFEDVNEAGLPRWLDRW